MSQPSGLKLRDFPKCFLCGRSLQRMLKAGGSCVHWALLDSHVWVLVCPSCTNKPRFEECCERKLRRLMDAEPAFNPPPRTKRRKHGPITAAKTP